jgi:hypothetical protein
LADNKLLSTKKFNEIFGVITLMQKSLPKMASSFDRLVRNKL